MRGIGLAFSRLPAAKALLAGATLLVGASAVAARTPSPGGDEVAMAIPRVSPFGGSDGVALPQPLPPSEVTRLRQVLALQQRGALDAAGRETEGLDTSTPIGQAMLGMVTADRYLGRHTRPDAAELGAWLTRWPDLSEAPALHALLLTRLPRGIKPPPAPSFPSLASAPAAVAMPMSPPIPEETAASERALPRNAELDRSVADAARHRGAAGVRRLLARTAGLGGPYASQLAGEAARILFTLNRDTEAYDIASDGMRACRAAHPDCEPAALAGYMAGLAAWRMERPDWARPMFEAAWRSDLTTPSLRAAAAFWAARARLRARDIAGHAVWLERAAAERNTFHGLIADRALGRDGHGRAGTRPGSGGREVLGQADLDAVAGRPEGLRAFALLQLGERDRAEVELRRVAPVVADQPQLARAVMLVADRAGLSGLAAQLADLLQALDGRPREETRFQVPRLRPDGGFSIDPAMLFALARTESNFDATLVSSAGAAGIMQIMPDTADFIATLGGGGHRWPGRARLTDPSANLALGQRYVGYLSDLDGIDGSLIRVLASYNCGPTRFAQWSAQVRDDDDPLLFIEAIPIDETRAYVPRVLTYTWLYARRLRLATPSLDELAAGEWPRHHPDLAAMAAGRLH